MARWWWRRRSREPVEDEPAPGSAPRVDPATIIDRYTAARPIGQGGATQPPGRGTGAATARLRM
ncbi:MAG: hypothetical protein JWM98_2616, partial [Thermoleophilia bacterium]|nr:hypothetical protein [Thermoleophilia bacterium]